MQAKESIYKLKESQNVKLKIERWYKDVLNIVSFSDLQRSQFLKECRLFGFEAKQRAPYLDFLYGGLVMEKQN